MNSLKKKNIIVDIERMKYPNTGLFNYCKNLAESLLKNNSYDYTFYLPKKVKLEHNPDRINTKVGHKLFVKPSRKFSLWHATYQTAKYIPSKPIKFVLTIHDLNFLYENKSEKKREKLLKKVQKLIDRADYITTISNFVLEDVRKNLNISGKRVKVIYNGVSLVKHTDFDSPKIRPEGKFYFSIGTVLPKKNFHVLLNLLQNTNSSKLFIAGIHPDDDYILKIWSKAKELGVSDKLVLLGPVSEEEKFWYLNNCEAFLFPSIAEGFGLPVIEAMLLGKPVFLSTHTSLPEIGGSNAFYFENFEGDHMRKVLDLGLKKYVDDQMSEGIKTWAEQFNWDRASQEYISVYDEVLNEKK
ncbi:glycosyltransferase family 4 protein [Tenacibaculum xiamenense]|uniref:glycosyltransferase family 4 protein n=1 Tax=Tenacibaculum xiamenense TaxID=1261553 RepID=UPI003895176D